MPIHFLKECFRFVPGHSFFRFPYITFVEYFRFLEDL